MKSFLPKELPTPQLHQLLLGTVAPRPIAFASTVSKSGEVNLSPFSFFNVFSAHPPIMIFSPARRVRDNTTKHTLENVLEVPEVTINIVNYDMVQQMSLASTEYDRGVNEFEKAGFTAQKSDLVTPPWVAEAPAAYECKVIEVKPLGEEGGAGNLVICEVLKLHIAEEVFTDNKVDPAQLDAVARMGGDWYCRAQGDALFEVAKPLRTKGIGVDQIPPSIRNSRVLTGNDLGMLGNVEQLPTEEEVANFAAEPEVSAILEYADHEPDRIQTELHKLASNYLKYNDPIGAWKVLLQEY
ncbi:flavin reductase family protein [Marinoscillum furvescens]|uniref:Flavin reductase (DIM6/NTAB) family NADH-FMN oxidoreductase RutF n=1 Tax=Marinoscillum furvescens DSM 4134 TaxID=1122208 RepID=A0A3D9L807_MARFU|nr:flavin reductase family protein [Marinoscillum furvescens]REE01251.1 flavin reductase (DIM6/NTAB) family NADH-FMN oxidoreductase RutF [Marinoscillum furvescens DSM 4134]